ncbi:MAG: hypothetical protein ACFB3T_03610 [Geminicoccaceae bacterium]
MSAAPRSLAKLRADEAWEYRIIYSVSFVFALVAAATGRVLPGARPEFAAGQSIIAEAKANAAMLVPFAFMR